MKILLSNDDGVDSAGLRALVEVFAEQHSVFVVAPDKQQSAVSKALTLYSPLRAVRYTLEGFPQVEAWAVSGTPVDCVRLGLGNLVPRPDVVISGINVGANLGTDTLYSGTCAAAQEAALRGFPAFAVSITSFRPKHLDVAARAAAKALPWVLENPLPFGVFYNINVPDLPEGEIRGVRRASLGLVEYREEYEERTDMIDRKYYWAPREVLPAERNATSDVRLSRENYITITALSYDNGLNCDFGEIAF
ncbi:MAG: 5'/3'-nucleotidase SurE [Clostridiales bacterium]|nr:5'/3'-nucleotidase SurE [Clostridiales bacterium]